MSNDRLVNRIRKIDGKHFTGIIGVSLKGGLGLGLREC